MYIEILIAHIYTLKHSSVMLFNNASYCGGHVPQTYLKG